MSNSRALFFSKGPSRILWVAAYCHNRLKKHRVSDTDISASVDEIMEYEVTLTYRVLGYLLLGVVRIYSNKVDYLYNDCNDILARINNFSVTRKSNLQIEAMSAQHVSFTFPEKFELDCFDIEVPEDVNRRNIRPREEITLEEAFEDEVRMHYSLNKYCSIEPSFQLDTCPSVHATFDDAPSPILDLDTVVNMVVRHSLNPSNLEGSLEMVRCSQFLQEECQDLNMLGTEVPLDMDPQFYKGDNKLDIEEHHVFGEDHLGAITPVQTPQESGSSYGGTEEPVDLDPQFDEVDNQVKRIEFLEITPLEIEHNVFTEDHQIAITSDGTQPELPCASGSATPESMVHRTPAQKEQVRKSGDRIHVHDDVTRLRKLSRKTPSHLVTRRRRVSHTSFDVWRAHIRSRIKQDFMEPLLLGISSELKTLFYERNANNEGPAEVAVSPRLSAELELETPCISSGQGATFQENSDDESMPMSSVVVPNTPMAQVPNVEEELSPIVTEDLMLDLINEDVSPHEGNNQDMDGWTQRTREVARHLQKSFMNQKNQTYKESLSLGGVTEGRTRTSSARIFYEILVLKTKGVIGVKQDHAYDDILVLKTPQLETI